MISGNANQIQETVWKKLQQIFNTYSSDKIYININQFELYIPYILKQDSPQQINYITKNLFKLDTDSNGRINFKQFANFLLKKQCGSVALQKQHKKNQISNSKERKINLTEFVILLNDAYSFLDITVSQQNGQELFRNQDTDKDGYITYIQYFEFNQRFLTREDFQIINEQRKSSEKQVFSRFRKYIWSIPNELCYVYDVDRNGVLDISQVTQFTKQILHPYSPQQVDYVLFSTFQLGSSKSIAYGPYMSLLIYDLAILGLARFQKSCLNNSKRLNTVQFLNIFIQTYYRVLLQQEKVRKLMPLFFKKIDTDNDGYITFREYARWIRQFIAAEKLYSYQYIVEEDDEQNPKSKEIWEEKKIEFSTKTTENHSFKFSSYDLADRFRSKALKQIIKFDINMDRHLDQGQITQIVKVLIKQNADVVKSVYNYDKDQDKKITYDQFATFLAEFYFGQLIVQNLNKTNTYSRGNQKILNADQFGITLNTALSAVGVKATEQQLKTLFNQVDQDSDGWISYADYFLFLRTYFGSLSTEKNIPKVSTADLNSQQGSPAERFSNLIRSQLKVIITSYDLDKNLRFDREEIRKILEEIFNMGMSEGDYVLNKIFKLNVSSNENFSYDELLDLLLRIYIGQLTLRRLHDVQKFPRSAQCLLNLQDFTLLIKNSLTYLNVLPDKNLLLNVFSLIDTDSDGWISYTQYFDFITKYLGGGRGDHQNTQVKTQVVVGAQEEKLYQDISSELRVLYNQYDINKDCQLSESELLSLVKDVLQETNKPQLDYIFRNLFRVDPNKDRKIDFTQFAPFMIKHSAELALQRFHIYNDPKKNTLTQQEFRTIVKNSYRFLKSISSREQTINSIFSNLDTNKKQIISYTDFTNWVSLVANRVH